MIICFRTMVGIGKDRKEVIDKNDGRLEKGIDDVLIESVLKDGVNNFFSLFVNFRNLKI